VSDGVHILFHFNISNTVYQQEGPKDTTSRGEVIPHQLLHNQWIGRGGTVELPPGLSSHTYGILFGGGGGGRW
jgi:hypothetical protein